MLGGEMTDAHVLDANRFVMDARMQKLRMTRWLGRLFVVLFLVASWGAEAAIEYVPRLNPPSIVWCSDGYNIATCKYPIDLEAAQSYLQAVAAALSNCPFFGYCFTLIGCDGNGNCTYSSPPYGLISSWRLDSLPTYCPVPAVNPTIPYHFIYENGMYVCKRTVPDNITYALTLTGMGGEIEPSGTSGGGNSTRTGYVTVLDAQSQPKVGAVVRITVNVDTSSGGHDHGESYARRDRGSISGCAATDVADAYDCTTSSNGSAQFTFNAPQASGTHSFTATCVQPTCTNSGSGNIDVKVDGLATIPASQFYTFVGGEADKPHHDNHYLTTAAASVLWSMAVSYQFEQRFQLNGITPPPLNLNDASLIWGGIFDVDGDWDTPHNEHMRGTVIDIRANSNTGAIAPANFDSFVRLAYLNGANAKIHNPGETSQHFHVRLLGRGE
jgi:hypothetical protein